MEELERTYLAKMIPQDLASYPSQDMLDIYIPSTSDHPCLRIRRHGDKLEITKKQPVIDGDASRQLEQTIPLNPEEYQELSTIPGKRISKTRYYYKKDNREFEIDIFKDGLAGLILVDIEFASIADKNAFTMPEFCLVEVTQEKFLAGGMLCGKSYTDIEINLQKFNYNKLIK